MNSQQHVKSVSSGPHIDMSISDSVVESSDESKNQSNDKQADVPQIVVDSTDTDDIKKSNTVVGSDQREPLL